MSRVMYVHSGMDPETLNDLLEQVDDLNRENKRLKRERSKKTKKLGYVCANDEFYGLTVYQNSKGRYVNDNGTRVNANRFKISRVKPK